MNNPLIYIVDDDTFAHHFLKSILKNFSLNNICHFFSGEECLECIHEKPDFVLLDFEMNGINGLKTMNRIKTNYPQTHVLLISGQEKIYIAAKAIKAGADNYFVKDANLAQNIYQYFQSKINIPRNTYF